MAVSTGHRPQRGRPWHLWAVALIALLWNGSGALTIFLAQAGRLPNVSADEAAYYAAQPLWFVLVTDVALIGALAAGIALLARHRAAVWLFAVSLAAILVTNGYDLAVGSSRAYANEVAMVVTGIIVVIAGLELVYARAMHRRGVLN